MRALELLKGGLGDLDPLIDERLRLTEPSTIHALAHAKALKLVDPPRAGPARLLRVIVEDVRQHSRLLSRIKVLVKGLERLR